MTKKHADQPPPPPVLPYEADAERLAWDPDLVEQTE